MLLENKNAIVYGGGGSVGGAVARAFAREGAKVFLAGRTLATLDGVAEEITAAGGVAEAAQVDVSDERAVEEHVNAVAEGAGSIDVLFNAIGMQDVPGSAPPRHAARGLRPPDQGHHEYAVRDRKDGGAAAAGTTGCSCTCSPRISRDGACERRPRSGP